jgi:predicted transposase/invertase (TIGR01784 family)
MKNNNHLNPHDRFVRHMMAKPKVIAEFFAKNLPNEIKKLVDIANIELQKESFIDDKLKLQITDLLYTTKFNEKNGYIYLLVEHQSTAKRLMPFRIAKYIIAIMDWHLQREDTETLPMVYPMIFYSGKTPYSHSLDFFDLFDSQKELAREILTNPFRLIDLTQTPDHELEEYLWYGVLAKTMKNIFASDINNFLQLTVSELKTIENHGDLDYIYIVISYIFETSEIKDFEKFRKIIKNGLSEKGEEKIMSFAEQLRNEGRNEGFREGAGEMQNKMLAAAQCIKQNKSATEIAKITGLPTDVIENLKQLK